MPRSITRLAWLGATLVTVVLAVMASPRPAAAQVPTHNGKIVYSAVFSESKNSLSIYTNHTGSSQTVMVTACRTSSTGSFQVLAAVASKWISLMSIGGATTNDCQSSSVVLRTYNVVYPLTADGIIVVQPYPGGSAEGTYTISALLTPPPAPR